MYPKSLVFHSTGQGLFSVYLASHRTLRILAQSRWLGSVKNKEKGRAAYCCQQGSEIRRRHTTLRPLLQEGERSEACRSIKKVWETPRISKEIENKKEPKRHSGAKDYNNWTEKFNNFNSRLDRAEENVNYLKDSLFKITQRKKKKSCYLTNKN